MSQREIQFIYHSPAAFDAAMPFFYDHFPQGFASEDPRVIQDHIERDDWDSHEYEPAILAQARLSYQVYVDDAQGDQVRDAMVQRLAAADLRPDEVAEAVLPDTDWETAWQEAFEVHLYGDRLQVVPDWLDPYEKGGDAILTITPGLAFGTGSHETTQMCLSYLVTMVEEGMTVFDIGCGSGILAVAARLLGADRVDAVDTDPVALRSAASLGARNDAAIMVYESDLLTHVKGQGDLVLANIVPDAIVKLFADLSRVLAPGGRLIASGIRTDREDEVVQAGQAQGYALVDRTEAGGWVALVFARKEEAGEGL